MGVLILEPADYSEQALNVYRQFGPVWKESVPDTRLGDVTLLVVRLNHRLDEGMLGRFPNLVAIATPTTGLSHIDAGYCAARRIRVYSLADCREAIEQVTSTSELTWGLIIALLRSIPAAHADVTVGFRWDRDNYRSRQLSRLTLGIIGLGRIGGHVAGYAKAFGMKVLACDPWQLPSRFDRLGVSRTPLEDLLAASDIVSLHADLRPDNVHLIGSRELTCMRSSALLINTARGALVDEAALVEALRSGRLAGAAVDVLESEHGEGGWNRSSLVAAARKGLNVIVTPHIGGCTSDAMHLTEERMAEIVARELRGTP